MSYNVKEYDGYRKKRRSFAKVLSFEIIFPDLSISEPINFEAVFAFLLYLSGVKDWIVFYLFFFKEWLKNKSLKKWLIEGAHMTSILVSTLKGVPAAFCILTASNWFNKVHFTFVTSQHERCIVSDDAAAYF